MRISYDEILSIVKNCGTISLIDLMKETGMKKSTLSMRLKKLCNERLIRITKIRKGRSFISEITLMSYAHPDDSRVARSPERESDNSPPMKKWMQEFSNSTIILSLLWKHKGVISKKWIQDFCQCYNLDLSKMDDTLHHLEEEGSITLTKTQIILRSW